MVEKTINTDNFDEISIEELINRYGGTEEIWSDRIAGYTGDQLNKLKRAIGMKEPWFKRFIREFIKAST